LREITTKAATEGGDWTLKLDKIRRIRVLAIDDLSQPKFTEAFASALFDLLEHRNSHRLAVLWTSQKSLPDLRSKIAEQCEDRDQADAISRRLIQDGLKLDHA
jgi:DNA replication protein DnaC